jgi:hypothetical protein
MLKLILQSIVFCVLNCHFHYKYTIVKLDYTIIYPNYADNKPKSFNITRIYMFAILDKAKPDTENIRLKLGGGQAL